MGKIQLRRFLSFFFPIFFFLFLSVILFLPYFRKGLVPISGDILLGHYYPWKDQVWDGRVAGYPVKNFILFDSIRQTLPWRLLAIENLKNGHWPFWNPYTLLGMPLLGNLQAAVFYPLNILFSLLPKLDAWTIYLFFQPFLAGIFGYFFGRTLNVSKKGSILIGICHGFSLIMLNHLEFGIDDHTALWLPLGLGAINKIQGSGQKKWAGVLMIASSMTLLGGYPPPAIYNLIIICLYAFFKIRPLISQKMLMIFMSLTFAFCLASPQLLPALELSKKVVREETQFGLLSNEPYFYPWENLAMIAAPDFFGHPSTNNYFSKIDNSDNPSVGILGLLFVFFSTLVILKNKEVYFWWFFAVLPMLLMLETPLGKFLRIIKIPFFSLVSPIKMIWIVSFSFSVLAGLGFDYLFFQIKNVDKLVFWKIFSPVILIWEVIFLLIIYVFAFLEGEYAAISLRNMVLPVFSLATTSVILVLCLFAPKLIGFFATIIILLSGGELLRQGIKYNPFIKKDLVYPQLEIFSKIGEEKKYWRSIITHAELIPVNANIPYSLSMVDGYASIYDDRAGQLIKLANAPINISKIGGYPRVVFQTEYKSPMIDLFGVKYIFSLEELNDDKLKLIASLGRTKIYENLKVFPRVFLVNKFWIEKNDLAIAKRMLTSDLLKGVVLEKEVVFDTENEAKVEEAKVEEAKVEEVSLERYEDNQILIKTISDQAGILVLTDSFDPGWQAFIDGRKTEVLRADYNLRAVVIPSGKHQILFNYFPRSFVLGRIIFIISVCFLICLVSLDLLKRRSLAQK